MKEYPQNRTYILCPVGLATANIGNVLELARHRLDRQYIIWDYPENSPKIKELSALTQIKILTHAQARNEVSKKEWTDPEDLTKLKKEPEI